MKKIMKSDKGFSLIEMLIVLLIITVLILITLPNVTKHSKSIDEKGCEAFVQMVQGQSEAYKIDEGQYPTSIKELESQGYLKPDSKCPNGSSISIQNGEVSVNSSGS